MKIAVGMKSNFAFERLKTALTKSNAQVEIFQENVQEKHTLDDAYEFWQPDYLVLDSKLPNFREMDEFASKENIEIIYFNSDFEAVVDYITSLLSPIEHSEDETKEVKDSSDYVRKEIKYIHSKPIVETVYQERVVEKEIYRTSYASIPNRLIVVASLWQGAGSTLFASNLARAISNRGVNVSYLEFPLSKPYMFDYLSISEQEFNQDKQYVDNAHLIKNGKAIRKSNSWKDKEIDWFINDSRMEPLQEFNYEDMLKYVYSINSTITIVDVSSNLDNQDVQDFLNHADDIYVCVEPDPVKVDWLSAIEQDGKLLPNQRPEKKVIDYLNGIEKQEGTTFEFVNMKYTKVVDNKTFWEGLGKTPLVFFPVIDYEVLIELVWKSELLYDHTEYQRVIEKAIKPVIAKALPRQYYSIKDKGNSGFRKITSIFNKGENK